MAIKSLNSVGGFSVTDSVTGNLIVIIDDNGNINTPTLTVTGNTNLGNLGNVTITGGTDGYVLATNGSGSLTWVAQSGGGSGNSISIMPSYISTGESYTLNANFQGLFAEPIVVDGALEIFGNLIDVSGNNYITGNGTLTINNFSATGVVNLTSTSNVSLGAVGNVHITGGTTGQVLTTDGSGNLSFSSAESGISTGKAIAMAIVFGF